MKPVESFPLLSDRPSNAVIARSVHQIHTVADFMADVARVVSILPAERFILNFCQNRYHFLVVFAAGLVSKKICLLPSTRTLAALEQIQKSHPDTFCLHDGQGLGDLVMPTHPDLFKLFAYPTSASVSEQAACVIPSIDASQIAAYVFTSGSTGSPVAHPKTWGSLALAARAECLAIGLDQQSWSLIGTVPSQHQYGLESLVMLTLQGGAQLWAGHPFYPVDIASAIEAMPSPRMLVTTPVHLRVLLAADIPYPLVHRLLSATAPLPEKMAQEAQALFCAPLKEKYGCTETGMLANRATAHTALWTLFPDVKIEARDGVFWAFGGHVTEPMPLADILEFTDEHHFLLQGRSSDLVNISGKRSSLAYLNNALHSVPDLEDGCMFIPEHKMDARTKGAAPSLADTSRVCAVVVAPKLSAASILQSLRERIDPTFLPRPIIFVPKLPRNETGKIPQAALQEIYFAHLNQAHLEQTIEASPA